MDTWVNSSTNSSLRPSLDECHNSRLCTSLFTARFISFIVLLPLFVFVLYLGYQRWRKQHSVATAATTSHSDIFTFNMVVLEMIGGVGLCFLCYGFYADQPGMTKVSMHILFIISPGQTLFHVLTCVDRYLAVVRPVTYLRLKQTGGVRIRNISVGCVWLLSFGSAGLSQGSLNFHSRYNFSFFVVSSFVVSFCSISVLCVLIRPGPGEVGGNRERVDQSKQRAFHMIMAIMGALLLRFWSHLVNIAIHSASELSSCDSCLVASVTDWFSLPSSLVLPLLFLQRAGKLPDCKHNTQSG